MDWRDLAIGIVLGLVLGVGVVVGFVFLLSDDTVDAPALSSSTGITAPAPPGAPSGGERAPGRGESASQPNG